MAKAVKKSKTKAAKKAAGKKKAAKKASSKKAAPMKAAKKAAKTTATRTPKPASGASKRRELRKGPQTEVTEEVLEFIRALDEFKKAHNRPFPTWSEILQVLCDLGYRKVND